MNHDDDSQVTLRAAIYTRVSSKEQGKMFGPEVQREACLALIKGKGLLDNGEPAVVLGEHNGVPMIFEDDISGTTAMNERVAMGKMIDLIENSVEGERPFDVVIVYKIDRLARSLNRLLEITKYLKSRQIAFISAREVIDTNTAFGRAMFNIMGVIAELERDVIQERTTGGRSMALKAGKFHGTHAPYGYIKNSDGLLEVLPEEAKIVERIFTMCVVEKRSPFEIAESLKNDEVEIPSISAERFGKSKAKSRNLNGIYFWRSEKVTEILTDEVYIGNLWYDKRHKDVDVPREEWKLSDYHHAQIITPQFFAMVPEILKRHTNFYTRPVKENGEVLYLLSHLLKCDHCKALGHVREGSLMAINGTKKKKIRKDGSTTYFYYYRCERKNNSKHSTTCNLLPIPAKPLEDFVSQFVVNLVSNPKIVFDYQDSLKSHKLQINKLKDSLKRCQATLNDIPKRRLRVLEQHKNGHITTIRLNQDIKELNESEVLHRGRLDDLNSQLTPLQITDGYRVAFDKVQEKYGEYLKDVTQDRAKLYELIHLLINEIVVYARVVKPGDIVAGKKVKTEQAIPNRIQVKLRLPQVLLTELITQRFWEKSGHLC